MKRLILFLVFSAFCVTSINAQIGLNLYGTSFHFDRKDKNGKTFNEINAGAGLHYDFYNYKNHTFWTDAGLVNDSFKNLSKFAVLGYKYQIFKNFYLGAGLYCSSTKSIQHGDPFLAPLPFLSYKYKRFSLNFTYLPDFKTTNIYPTVASYITIDMFDFKKKNKKTAKKVEDKNGDDNKKLALEFAVSKNFTLENFKGSVISLKKQLSEKNLLRLGVDFNGSIDNNVQEKEYNDTTKNISSTDYNKYKIGLYAQYLWKVKSNSKIDFYIGLGPQVGYYTSFSESKTEQIRGDNRENSKRTGRTHSWSTGLIFSFGTEWKVADNISLFAEYGIDALYFYRKTKNNTREVSSSKSFRINENNVKLGLCVYF